MVGKFPDLGSIKARANSLRTQRPRKINVDVFFKPEKYLIRLPVEKIVADTKVSREGVERYKQKILNKEKVGPIIVIKHPNDELYAVLDGHHRYFAHLELDEKEIDCALAGDYSSVVFYMTKHGYFQPNKEITEHVRAPAHQFHLDLEKFLSDFLKDPSKLEKKLKIYANIINDKINRGQNRQTKKTSQ